MSFNNTALPIKNLRVDVRIPNAYDPIHACEKIQKAILFSTVKTCLIFRKAQRGKKEEGSTANSLNGVNL